MATSSLVKSLVSQALLNDPNNMEVMDYLDLLEARNELSSEKMIQVKLS